MDRPTLPKPTKDKTYSPLILLFCLFSFLSPVNGTSPHIPKQLTWQVLSQRGEVIWSSTAQHTPNTWWPTLYPDLCQLAMGSWDIGQHDDPHKPPTSPTSRGMSPPNRGCGDGPRRYKLSVFPFYVCPAPKNSNTRGRAYKCGGPSDFYCAAWGCETTGDVYWKPTSNWDYITVTANYSHQLGGFWERENDGKHCKNAWCHPLKITFTESGKKAVHWTKGYSWGLRLYKENYDEGLIFTIKLSIQSPSAAIGPNPVLPDQRDSDIGENP